MTTVVFMLDNIGPDGKAMYRFIVYVFGQVTETKLLNAEEVAARVNAMHAEAKGDGSSFACPQFHIDLS